MDITVSFMMAEMSPKTMSVDSECTIQSIIDDYCVAPSLSFVTIRLLSLLLAIRRFSSWFATAWFFPILPDYVTMTFHLQPLSSVRSLP